MRKLFFHKISRLGNTVKLRYFSQNMTSAGPLFFIYIHFINTLTIKELFEDNKKLM